MNAKLRAIATQHVNRLISLYPSKTAFINIVGVNGFIQNKFPKSKKLKDKYPQAYSSARTLKGFVIAAFGNESLFYYDVCETINNIENSKYTVYYNDYVKDDIYRERSLYDYIYTKPPKKNTVPSELATQNPNILSIL